MSEKVLAEFDVPGIPGRFRAIESSIGRASGPGKAMFIQRWRPDTESWSGHWSGHEPASAEDRAVIRRAAHRAIDPLREALAALVSEIERTAEVDDDGSVSAVVEVETLDRARKALGLGGVQEVADA